MLATLSTYEGRGWDSLGAKTWGRAGFKVDVRYSSILRTPVRVSSLCRAAAGGSPCFFVCGSFACEANGSKDRDERGGIDLDWCGGCAGVADVEPGCGLKAGDGFARGDDGADVPSGGCICGVGVGSAVGGEQELGEAIGTGGMGTKRWVLGDGWPIPNPQCVMPRSSCCYLDGCE